MGQISLSIAHERWPLKAPFRFAGYRVDAAAPISASWSLQTDEAVALFAGVAIED